MSRVSQQTKFLQQDKNVINFTIHNIIHWTYCLDKTTLSLTGWSELCVSLTESVKGILTMYRQNIAKGVIKSNLTCLRGGERDDTFCRHRSVASQEKALSWFLILMSSRLINHTNCNLIVYNFAVVSFFVTTEPLWTTISFSSNDTYWSSHVPNG